MEVKVMVDGLPRVVCGVTEKTTCQEVVIALAQALGQTGRYVLQEKFKDFERFMVPDEHLLETLEKYGEQARDVRLTLIRNGPSVWDDMSKTKVQRYQACPPLRRKDAGTSRIRRGSSSMSLHRQSLPPLSCFGQDEQKEDLKRPKRKSLTLMEEAWEWLESLGKSKVYNAAQETESKKTEKKNRTSLGVSLAVGEGNSVRSVRGKSRGPKGLKSKLDHETSCCMGGQTRDKDILEKTQKAVATSDDKKLVLIETIIYQLSCLQELQVTMGRIDKQILELEEAQRAKKAEQEAQQRTVEEEMEQIRFWENELKAEEGYEKDLQRQFLEMKANVAECKAKLEEYRRKKAGLDPVASQDGSESPAAPAKDLNKPQSDPDGDRNANRKCLDLTPPYAVVPPSQIKERRPTGPMERRPTEPTERRPTGPTERRPTGPMERRPTGPTELREWWTRWSQAQSPQPQTKRIHRSELTIYLGSTKV